MCTENCGTAHDLGIVGQTDIVTSPGFYRTTPLPWSHGALLQGRENKSVQFFKTKKNERYLKDL